MQGSDAELEEAAVTSHRAACVMLAQQPRRAFHQLCNLSDKDSSELWNSSHMECRPFKDPTYDLRRMEQDMAVQAVPLTQELSIQATPARVSACLLLSCVLLSILPQFGERLECKDKSIIQGCENYSLQMHL